MEINTQEVFDAINALNHKGIGYIEENGFDEIFYDDLEDSQRKKAINELSPLFDKLYENVFIVGVIRNMNLDVFNTGISMNYFENDNGVWRLQMYEPEISIKVSAVLELSTDELFEKYPELNDYTVK